MNKFLFSNQSNAEINIYADKSASILEWLLTKGLEKERITLSEVKKDLEISIGLIQKVFNHLVFHGYLKTEGHGTSKRFILFKPKSLIISWRESYNIMKKCKMWTYSSSYRGREKMFEVLSNSRDQAVVALHAATNLYKCSHTNLETLELYIPDLKNKSLIEKELHLEPQNRGYDVLLIEPYYKHMVHSCLADKNNLHRTSPILTYLDLYHFPLRGIEQAEYFAENEESLKKIFL